MNPRNLIFVLGDQLTRSVSALRDADKVRDVVFMAEVHAEASTVKHHKQKIIFVFSAMRHFAQALRDEGFVVDYVKLSDDGNTGTLGGELARALERHSPDRIIVTEPSEWRVGQDMKSWPVREKTELRPDDRFIASREDFAQWARERETYRMEFFYRTMRRKTGYLMRDGVPEGGQWNFDTENRKKLPAGLRPPARLGFTPDAITRDVMDLVEARFPLHFGRAQPFHWGVTRRQALQVLDHFIAYALPFFGDFQDAMKTSEDFLFHSALSPYLNFGLLTPHEVCEAAIRAGKAGQAPLNAVEGFIRQIIGWREFVRGLYGLEMPAYAQGNFLQGQRKLPAFYWTGDTPMKCLQESLRNTIENAYAHHIQRLMVLGNFALLAGVAPAEIEEWFLAVYVDALEWVELPNVHGMVMHADGGLMASKPYAASGAYINRMSDYCAGCRFDPRLKTGPGACPFNALYWNFLMENEQRLSGNPRMALPYQNLAKMDEAQRQELAAEAQSFLDTLE